MASVQPIEGAAALRPGESLQELYLRGTTKGFPGSPALQELPMTPTTLDPRRAVAFGTEASRHGEGVVHIATAQDLAGVAQGPSNFFARLEAAVNWRLRPAQFAERAAVRDLPLEHAREALQALGHELPPTYLSPGGLHSWLENLPVMPEGQVRGLAQQFFEAVQRAR